MKTFQELVNENGGCYVEGQATMTMITEARYKQIQLDSFKAGEKFAAELVEQNSFRGGDAHKKAILTDANNRTELP